MHNNNFIMIHIQETQHQHWYILGESFSGRTFIPNNLFTPGIDQGYSNSGGQRWICLQNQGKYKCASID